MGWTYSGVRPLYDDGSSNASAVTREYVLKLDHSTGAPVLNVFGGKITTYRKLAEAAMTKLGEVLPGLKSDWTKGVPLPGGDFPVNGVQSQIDALRSAHPFLTERWAKRLIRAYGTEAATILTGAQSAEDLGEDFGATITARELDWSIANEWTRKADDVLWRRTKLGLRLNADQITRVDAYIAAQTAQSPVQH